MDNKKICEDCGLRTEEENSTCPFCGSKKFLKPDPTTSVTPEEGETDSKKTCDNCGLPTDINNSTCPYCGSDKFKSTSSNNPLEEFDNEENVLTGLVGAILFSLIGGVVYYLIYQLNVIAGISGWITFALANYGYKLFGKCRKKTSKIGVIIAAVLTFVVIFVTNNYICLASDIVTAFADMGRSVSFAEALDLVPEFMSDSEVSSAVYENLAFACGFALLAIISDVAKVFKKKK